LQTEHLSGRVIDFRCPISFPNGVLLKPGDLVFGDLDGVVVVPSDDEREVIQDALEKARGENAVRKSIEEGMSAREAFDRYGVM
jgi:regulator of RNase E activity RraA